MAKKLIADVRSGYADLLLEVCPSILRDRKALLNVESVFLLARHSGGKRPWSSNHRWTRFLIPGSDSSANCSSRPGLFVRNMSRFHSHTHISADGSPELTDAPAPTNTQTGDGRLTPIDLTRASKGRIKPSFPSCVTDSLSDWAMLGSKTFSPVQMLQPNATAGKSKKWAPSVTGAPLITLDCNEFLACLGARMKFSKTPPDSLGSVSKVERPKVE